MPLVVTGFGKFGTILDNPLSHLCRQCAEDAEMLEIVETCVLETSAEGAMQQLAPLYAKYASQEVVFVHLGVNASIDHLEMESTAYNCANFSIPDERGWLAENETIDAAQPLHEALTTSLKAAEIVRKCQAKGFPVQNSTDPGRYICNYVYYQSLVQHGSKAVFIHVPPFAQISLLDQKAILYDLLRSIN